MTDELAAAAERLKLHYAALDLLAPRESPYCDGDRIDTARHDRDVQILIDSATERLAGHAPAPADDHEPPNDEAFLSACGFAHLAQFKEWDHPCGLRCHMAIMGDRRFRWSFGNRYHLKPDDLLTRGRVRQLLSSLGYGYPVKETSSTPADAAGLGRLAAIAEAANGAHVDKRRPPLASREWFAFMDTFTPSTVLALIALARRGRDAGEAGRELAAVIQRAKAVIGSDYDNAGVVIAAFDWLEKRRDECGQLRQYASYCRSCAQSGESDPVTFEEFVVKLAALTPGDQP
jgi:hypothetical protein